MKLKQIIALVMAAALLCGTFPAVFAGAGRRTGDVSGDGEIAADDARLCLRQAVGLEHYEEGSEEFIACDVTFDNQVAADDARLILRAAVGLETLREPVRLVVDDGIQRIGADDYAAYDQAQTLVLPISVKTIAPSAFSSFSLLKDVYYAGSEEDWKKVTVGENNAPLQNATIHFSDHVHTPGDPVEQNKKPATCAEEGSVDLVVICTGCGAELSRTPQVIAKTAHTPGAATEQNKVAATCTAEGGYDKVVACKVCKAELSREHVAVPKTAHTPGDPKEENKTAATCTAEGGYDTVTYCTVCGAELNRAHAVIAALGHTPGAATEQNRTAPTCAKEGGYDTVVSCAVCGAQLSSTHTSIAKLTTHTPGAPTKQNEVAATCAKEGGYDEVVSCAVCGVELSRTPRASAKLTTHSLTYRSAVSAPKKCTDAPSCIAHYECTVCGKLFDKNDKTKELDRAAVYNKYGDHNFVTSIKTEANLKDPGTCTVGATYYKVCSYCGALSTATFNTTAPGHNYVAVFDDAHLKTAATCTKNAVYNKACSGCGKENGDPAEKSGSALGHDYSVFQSHNTLPTCTAGGTDTYKCSRCTSTKQVSVPQNPANHPADKLKTENINVTAATCTATGSYIQVTSCTGCGAELSREVQTIAKVAHKAGSATYENVVPATCAAAGSRDKVIRCKVCGAEISRSTQSISKLDHNFVNTIKTEANLKTAGTCTTGASYYMICSKCGALSSISWSETPPGHNYVAVFDDAHLKTPASCLSDAIYRNACSVCGRENGTTTVQNGSALGHDYSAFQSHDSIPTCTMVGYDIYKCSRCTLTSRVQVSKDPNNHPDIRLKSQITGVVEPTCSSSGEYYESTVCDACGKVVVQGEHHIVDPLPHNTYYVAATPAGCESTGIVAHYRCDTCGKCFSDAAGANELATVTEPARGHNYGGSYTRVYRVQTTCTVNGVYNDVLYCVNCGIELDRRPEQTENAFNHMKNGASAIVDVPAADATCNEPAHAAGRRCTLCGWVESGLEPDPSHPALGHDFSLPASCALGSGMTGFYCVRGCGAENPDKLGAFNRLVNAIKTTSFAGYYDGVCTFSRTDSVSDYHRFRSTGIVNILPNVRSQFDSEMRKSETKYSRLISKGWIKDFLYLKSASSVSLLDSGDLAGITVRRLSGLTANQIFDHARYPDTYTLGANTYNLAQYKNKTISGDVIAVTVTLKQQTYTPAGGVAGVSAEQPTALQKLVGTDVRTLATQYGENGVMTEEESDTGYSMNSTMRLKNIVSNANVTYYFAASNYEPIAAVYNTSFVTSQDVSMNISIAGSAGSITVDPFVTETTQDVFLFSGFPMG